VDRYQYLLLMGACLALTLPLEFVYGARVWRDPRRLVTVLAIPAVVFAVWDVLAIRAGVWDFNPRYVTGWLLPFDLPVEEAAFFITIPICSILAYEAVRRSLQRIAAKRADRVREHVS
jgi:lycopene cyclase domain-containing protein